MESGQEAEGQHISLFGVLWGAAGWLDIGKFWGQGQAMLAQGWGREKAPLNLLDPCLCQRDQGGRYQWGQARVMGIQGQQQHNLMESLLTVLFFCSRSL